MNFSRSAVFHMKTRVCLKYFENGCRYFKVSISISVENKHRRFVNMWESPKHSTHHLNELMTDRLLSQLNRNLTNNSPYLPME